MGLDIAKASLHELGEIESDSIIVGEIDDKLVDLPSYRELYHRWEKQQWSTQDLDFSIDRQNWAGVSEENRPVWISGFVVFFQGEVSVVNTLIPYLAAAPTEEQRIFLTTQLADEARHATFFDKFFREALLMDGPDIESILVKIRPLLLPAQREILMEGLAEVGQKIHDEPKNIAYLVEGVTLYHIITEGTLALAGQRNMLNRNKRLGWYPAFQQGFTAVARDESRHVLFGVRFLRDMVQQDQAHAGTIRNTIARWLPQIRETLYLSEMQRAVLTAFGEDPNDVINFGMSSLRKKLKVIGVKHNF
jgi:ribonucleoside-diphosphate reductase beta chain